MVNEIKLNLGCGDRKIHGYTNVDIDERVDPDVIDDVIRLEKFKASTIQTINVSHVLEHLNYNDSILAMGRWHSLLVKDGILRIAVPNLEKVCAHFFLYQDLEVIRAFLWGGQHNEYDYHKNGWNFESLRDQLKKIGFKNIKEYNWMDTEHSYVDDYSQAYLPHMDKVNGILMSLNVECTK